MTLLTKWKTYEPVRLYLYGVLVPIVLLAVGYGLVTSSQAVLWLGVLAAALGAPATEAARGQVTAPGNLEDPELG